MTSILGERLRVELICLWLLDFGVCFGAVYLLLSSEVAPGLHPSDVRFSEMPLRIAEEAALVALTMSLASFAVGLYDTNIGVELRRLVVNTALSGTAGILGILLLVSAAGWDAEWRHGAVVPLKMAAAWVVCVSLTHLGFYYATRMNLFVRRVVIVGADRAAARTAVAMKSLRSGIFQIDALIPPDELTSGQDRIALPWLNGRGRKIWAVILTPQASDLISSKQLLPLKLERIRVYKEQEFWERHLRRLDLDELPSNWLRLVQRRGGGRVTDAVHRLMDIVLSTILLLFTLPLMLLAALLIKLDSPGPIFYRQERVGLHGEPFTLFKFRSMRADAEIKGPVWAAQSDPRVTRIGGFIRRMRIDELPQLVNVLSGQMSLIGPRPERPHFVEKLEKIMPLYADRAYVKPGLTGWAQVNFPYGASIEDAWVKLSYDLYYVKNKSIFLDIMILFATVRVVLFQEGSR
jgi:sugar transferase (PEP-CTERM system associated)